MKPAIITQLQRLGGTTDGVTGASLQADLAAIVFKNPLYPASYLNELTGVTGFWEQHQPLYHADRSAFCQLLLEHFFADHEVPYGQAFFRNFLFTPFKAGSPDEGELDGLVTPDEIREVVAAADLDFMCICYSYGFPDHYFVCLTDTDQENPAVYGTDHEVFFSEITKEGTLEAFFNDFITPAEFLAAATKHLENREAA
ncbi:hypothetical protein QMK33_17985 [Hymenobacter sp. H14-R3]|uniref:hypothetical protein n=1 Tax=Hymenobacter sp. H14-R3 TaxID=3046308 RepID=UPI0024BAA9E5|nr:hypothetical protein [Hymenobacter sp. H14-R3]MDJ0367044.1 hypothetical protein [Hymenobacter sp. H14-R3]